MARKPRMPNEPVEPEQPTEPVREEEKLPWLQRVEDDEPASAGTGGRLAGYAVGAALLIIAILAIGYAIVSRQHGPPEPAPEENLAGLIPDQSATGNGQAGNESAPASSAADSGKAGAHRHHKAKEGAVATATSGHAGHRGAVRKAHETGKVETGAGKPEKGPRAHERAPGHRQHKEPTSAPTPKRYAATAARRAAAGPTDLVQLGAYDSRAAAERVWSALSRSRPYSDAAHRVERARVHGHVYYRLRVELPARTRQCVRHGRAPCMVVRWAR